MRTRFLALAALALVVSGCTGSGSDGDAPDADPAVLGERLSAARTTLDSAESIQIKLATTALPDGVTGLLSASGQGNHSPAFEGKVVVVTGGTSLDADVIAVDGKVWTKTSFTPVYLTIDPADLKAPDPASLLDSETGITQILEQTNDLTDGGKSRDGSDVLTTISGTLLGSVVSDIIPSADQTAEFTVTYRLTDTDELRDATLTGPFYPGGDDVTYKVTLEASDDVVTIEAPSKLGL